jgi:hypothetical protein
MFVKKMPLVSYVLDFPLYTILGYPYQDLKQEEDGFRPFVARFWQNPSHCAPWRLPPSFPSNEVHVTFLFVSILEYVIWTWATQKEDMFIQEFSWWPRSKKSPHNRGGPVSTLLARVLQLIYYYYYLQTWSHLCVLFAARCGVARAGPYKDLELCPSVSN